MTRSPFRDSLRRSIPLLALGGLVALSAACTEDTPDLATAKQAADSPSEDEDKADDGDTEDTAGAPAKGSKKAKARSKKAKRGKAASDKGEVNRESARAGRTATAARVGDAPPMPAAGPAEGIRMNMRIDDGEETHEASVSAGFQGANIQMNSRTTVRQEVRMAEPPPVQQRRSRSRTCKAALIANGHEPVHMVHCSGVSDRCAVALLNAGHNPSSLVHCSDVGDVTCAVNLMRSGKSPSSIVHCD